MISRAISTSSSSTATPTRFPTGSSPAHDPESLSTGHGLLGMRERVLAAGGTLEFGPTTDGGFRLLARLPLGARREQQP